MQTTELQAALGQGSQNIVYASPATAFEDSGMSASASRSPGHSSRTPRSLSSTSPRAPWT
jgi:hypothetical protein